MSALESPRTSHDPQPRPELPVSYLDYLARLKDSKPCLDWLHQFFQWRPHEPEGQMDVFDVVGGRIQVRSSESITLGDRAADVDFRIVQLSYESEWDLDRTLLDSVCFTFDLDPFAVWVCFEDDYSHHGNPLDSRNPKERPGPLPRQLPSYGDFLCLPFDTFDQRRLFAVFARSRDQGPLDTLVVFIKDAAYISFYRPDLDFTTTEQRTSVRRPTLPCDKVTEITQFDYYAAEILAWDDKAYVPTPENNLIHFVLPHVRHLLNNFSQRLERFRLDTASALNPDVPDAWDGNVRKEERIYFGVYTYGERISQCATSLDHFLALHQKKPSTALKNATDDFAILLKEAIELRDALHDQLGRRAAILSLQESRKSIQMADSLKTLTQLAFVFTPLNFAMSIFGANIVEFGSGTAPAWALAVTAVVIGLTTMLTWLVWSKIKGTLKAHASHIRAIFKLAQRSPALGLLLLVVLFTSYGAIKRDDPDDLLFDTLGIAPLIKKPEHEYSELERASLSDFEPPPVGTPFLEAFCQNSLRQIATYTSQEGWQLDRFYKPWIRWRRHAAARRAVLRQGSNESGDRNSV